MTTYETNLFVFAPCMNCFSNRHFKFAAVFEYYAVRSNVFPLVMNPAHTHHSDYGGWEVDLCSFTPLRIHPYTIFLTQDQE